jgi:hypothetical protein
LGEEVFRSGAEPEYISSMQHNLLPLRSAEQALARSCRHYLEADIFKRVPDIPEREHGVSSISMYRGEGSVAAGYPASGKQ